MKFSLKVAQEVEGNKWFERNIRKLQSNNSLTETQLKTIIGDAIAYFLIDAISFRMFIASVDQIGERPEVKTMPEINETIDQLLSLSCYNLKSKTHRKGAVNTFSVILNYLK